MLHALPFTTFGEGAALGLEAHVCCPSCNRSCPVDPTADRLRDRCFARTRFPSGEASEARLRACAVFAKSRLSMMIGPTGWIATPGTPMGRHDFTHGAGKRPTGSGAAKATRRC
jgi:hypothetical protein